MLKLDDCIVCVFQIGVLNQVVYLPDGTQTTVPTKDLALYIVSFSQSYANYSVKLVGHPAYAEEFIERIRKEEIKQYKKNIIDIEIIGGNN